MTRECVQKKVHALVAKCINAEEGALAYDDDLRGHGMDSINCIVLIVEIEDLFHFEFADEDLVIENFMTINQLTNYVIRKINE